MKKWMFLVLFLSAPVFALTMPEHALKKLEAVHYDAVKPIHRADEDKLFEKYILILFFSNQCPHCISFAPILKQYGESQQVPIEPITLNGQTLPEFPNAQFATQEMIDLAYQGKPVVYPALFLANTQNHTLYPISFGEMTYSELSERINLLRSRVAEYERSH